VETDGITYIKTQGGYAPVQGDSTRAAYTAPCPCAWIQPQDGFMVRDQQAAWLRIMHA
jgi:hypothetical protein